jgi:hypothetical protein
LSDLTLYPLSLIPCIWESEGRMGVFPARVFHRKMAAGMPVIC